jgi:glycosyltransferase involved in cell wall biosynthesis
MGVDVKRFDGKATTSCIPNANELLAFENRILFVGKLFYYKGVRYLLEAFSKLASDEVCLMVVGDGAERPNLTSMARRLGISNRVYFLGTIPDSLLPSTYALANLVVLPSISRREAFGMVILEAMASGKPVVASAIPGVSDVVDHGKTGYLVPPRDPERLSKAIDSVLQNPSNAARMGEEARVTARLRYDWEQVYSSYVSIYERLNSLSAS